MAWGTAALLGLTLVAVAASACTAMGKAATGERRARMERSPQWKDGSFENPQPLKNDFWGSLRGLADMSDDTSPAQPLPTVQSTRHRFDAPPATGLRVTWLGHSSTLVEIDGHRVLTDPVWSERASPLSWVGPKRWYGPPIALEDLLGFQSLGFYERLGYERFATLEDYPPGERRYILRKSLGPLPGAGTSR